MFANVKEHKILGELLLAVHSRDLKCSCDSVRPSGNVDLQNTKAIASPGSCWSCICPVTGLGTLLLPIEHRGSKPLSPPVPMKEQHTKQNPSCWCKWLHGAYLMKDEAPASFPFRGSAERIELSSRNLRLDSWKSTGSLYVGLACANKPGLNRTEGVHGELCSSMS
uniref:Uncharacterized protein n=1 Tax=Strigops habroptila TaxID=2489341 RepID=A0A672UQZ1_STRHB